MEGLLLSIGKFNQSGLVETITFRRASLEIDRSIHLHWESERPDQNGSSLALGLRLAKALEEFGLVDHSIWVEKEK
jgi:hypothetical protein